MEKAINSTAKLIGFILTLFREVNAETRNVSIGIKTNDTDTVYKVIR